jgi:DNA polymerase-3 subunit epsilon
LTVLRASAEESAVHEDYLDMLDKKSGGACVWKRLEAG